MSLINKSMLPLDEWLMEVARQIFAECDKPERARAQTSTTLRRRFRGTSKSDLLGRFSVDPNANGVWLGDGPEQELLMNMYGFHVVKPIIKANQSSMQQAQVECTVTPTSKNPGLAGVASIGKGIYRYINNHPDYWSNNLKSQIAQQCQTDPGYFIRTYHDPEAESLINITVDEWADQPVEQPGEYACKCGAGGVLFSEQMGQAANGQIPCLAECGEMAEIIEMPTEKSVPFEVGKTEYPAGNTVQDVISAFQVRVDERKTKNGRLRKADWFEHHFLMSDDDLQAMVPYFDIGASTEWSYPLKWEYSLETGTDLYLKPWSADGTHRRPQHEVRRIYLRPGHYRHYRSPTDFVLDRGDGYAAMDREGNPMLAIKAGQRLIDLFPNGFWFIVANNLLLPCVESCDFRDEWAYGFFLNDSASFWAQCASELNELQRAANNLYTIEMQHLESASITTTIFDRNWFNIDDFERGLSPTKEGTHIEPGDSINNHHATVNPPQLHGVMEGMNFIRSLVPDVSGVQPAAVGAPSPGEPYAAQRLQRQQSLGLLTPAQQSMAECKATVVLQHLKIAQKTKPLEWFQYIGTIYGEEWKQQDIEAFLNANLDLDIFVSYKEGSEIPTSLIEQEIKYRQYLLDYAQVAQYIPDIVDATAVSEMFSQYGALAGINHDFDDVEAGQRLADSRYQKIRTFLDANRDSDMPEELLVQVALADRSLLPNTGEEHETHIEAYQDHMNALSAAADPDYPLIAACKQMIKRHQDEIKAAKQIEAEIEVEGDAPILAAQAMAAQQAAAQEAEKIKLEAAARAQDNEANLQRQALIEESRTMQIDKKLAHDARQKAADRQLKAVEIATKEPTSIEAPEAPIDPMQSIMESIDYSELGVPAQTAVLREVGLPTAGIREVHEATIAKSQIAASKARASQSRSNNGSSK